MISFRRFIFSSAFCGIILALVVHLVSAGDANSAIPAYRFCRVVKYEGKHYRAIVQKVGLREYKLIKICFKNNPIDYALDAGMCTDGEHLRNGIWWDNREYTSIVCEYNYEHFKVLDERCWKNCGPMEVNRTGCEYIYPKSCFVVKNLFNSDPCKAYTE